MLDQALLELLNQFSNPITMAIPWLAIAIGASALIEGGIGWGKARKGKRMEEQALSDRSMYLGQLNNIMQFQQGQSEGYRDMITGGVPGGGGLPTVGDLPYSSLNRGQDQVQSQVGGWLNTIGNIQQAPYNPGIQSWEDKSSEKQALSRKMRGVKRSTARSSSRHSGLSRSGSGLRSHYSR